MKKLLLSLLLFFSLACSLTSTPTPSATIPPAETTAPPQVPPTETATATPSGNRLFPPPTVPRQPPTPGRAGSPCGNGICEGPENAQNCPADCARTPGPSPTGRGERYTVTNPTSGASLAVYVNLPAAAAELPVPALVLVPGGSGGSSSFRRPNAEFDAFVQAGYVVVVFDPDGRGQSTGA